MASADSEPDLFWAIRGGGNFGVVTSFTFRLHEVGPLVAFACTFHPLKEVRDVERRWRDLAVGLPDEVSYLDELTDEAIETVGAVAADRPFPLTLVNTYHLGGAVHRVGAEDTAFAERSSPFMVSVDTMWSDPA